MPPHHQSAARPITRVNHEKGGDYIYSVWQDDFQQSKLQAVLI